MGVENDTDTSDIPDSRAAAEAAYNEVAAAESEAAPAPPPESTTEAAPALVVDVKEGETEEQASQRARDEHGRFTKQEAKAKEAASDTRKPLTGNSATPPPVPGQATETKPPPRQELKAPGGWSPLAREKWTALPAEVQAEVHRRERDHATALERYAPVVRAGQAFQQIVAPYEGLMRAQGAEPLQAVEGVLKSYATLTMGPPEQKAAILARLFKHSGLPVEALAAAIDGTPQPAGQSQGLDLQTLREELRQDLRAEAQRERQQYVINQAQQEVAAFGEKFEFYDDVRDDMSLLMHAAAQRGKVLSAEQAYKTALLLPQHEELQGALKQREAEVTAKAEQAKADRARAAGSSVRGQPAVAPPGQTNGVYKDSRDAAAAAYEEVMSRT